MCRRTKNTVESDLNIEDFTAAKEYLEIVKSEYEHELIKKQSFENRAGLILAFLGAVSVYLFENIHLKSILPLLSTSLTFLTFIEIVSLLGIYFAFIFTMYKVLSTISTKLLDNFQVKNIDEDLILEERFASLCRCIFTYRDIIIQNRELNEKKACSYKQSLYGISVMFVSIIIYSLFL